MKRLQLQNHTYKKYESGFGEWLQRIGMSHQAVYNMPLKLREFLHYMEQSEIHHMDKIGSEQVQAFFTYLAHRPNATRGGSVSMSHYNKYIQALKKFSTYLWQYQKIILPITIKRKVISPSPTTILTQEEIAALYDATSYHPQLCLRDQVLLDVFYCCGLRRNEGAHLKVTDIHIDRRVLYVSHGKNYTNRYVPFTNTVASRIQRYIQNDRKTLLKNRTNTSLLISDKSRSMQGQSMFVRVKRLQEESHMSSLQNKKVGLHTLRHSIATHLLHKGMKLQEIAIFLGHKSIESTQIYTRLVHEL